LSFSRAREEGLTRVGFLQLNSGEGETREIGKESREGRGKIT
jgi:hypothetical protein